MPENNREKAVALKRTAANLYVVSREEQDDGATVRESVRAWHSGSSFRVSFD
jgi:hypothetical protein